MDQAVWKKTACILCYANCGLEVQTEGRGITRIRGDKDHPRSHGYLCQKATRLTHYQNHPERLASPMRRREDGSFEEVDWDTALSEIAEKFLAVREKYGPRALGHYGGGGQGNHSGGGYGIMMMRALGATDFYSSLAQEKSGRFWVNGRMYGAQNCNHVPLMEGCDLLVLLGSSMWEAQCEPGARDHLNEASKSDGKKILCIDPVRTKDAEMADVHLQLKPGTDTYLLGAMLKLLIERGAQDEAFIAEHTEGWPAVREALLAIPADDWIAHTGLTKGEVEQAVDMIAEAEAMVLRSELGIEQGRNSTLNSYLNNLLFLVPGHFGRPGTQAMHTWLQPLFGNSKGATSVATGMQEIAGLYPPNRFAAEVLNDGPNALRAVLVDSSNPANSAANTAATEEALRSLDLLVVVDVAMTETARLADYVLPASSQLEKFEFTFFNFSFPANYFHVRHPLFEPLEGTRVEADIYADLSRRMGLLPDEQVIDDLPEQAVSDRLGYSQAVMALAKENPVYGAIAPLILYLTLGKSLPNGAASAAILWPACHKVSGRHTEAVQRALGTDVPPPMLGEVLFDRIINSPSGTKFTEHTMDDIWSLVAFPDKKFRLEVPEMLEWLARIDPADDQPDADYPFVVSLGQRRRFNSNQIVRTPRFRRQDYDGAIRVHPDDLNKIGSSDGGWVTVETRTGKLTARAEADDAMRLGYAALPQGYGMAYTVEGGERVTVGPRINLLAASDDCDPLTDTPYHKNVAAALRAATNEEAASSEEVSAKVQAYVAAG